MFPFPLKSNEKTTPAWILWAWRRSQDFGLRHQLPYLMERVTNGVWLVVEPTHLKNMLVKLDHFPRGRGENKKYLKPLPYLIERITNGVVGSGSLLDWQDGASCLQLVCKIHASIILSSEMQLSIILTKRSQRLRSSTLCHRNLRRSVLLREFNPASELIWGW